MAGNYTQIYLQFVFAVQHREALIRKEFKEDLNKYITKISENRKAKMLRVNCMPDHTHIFVGFHPSVLISDFVKEIKVETHELIDKNNWASGFQWQGGYGAFSYSRSQIPNVCDYISNQEIHHKNQTFREEYLKILNDREVDYDERFLFDWLY